MKTHTPVYRCTSCDDCHAPKSDCIWVMVPSRENDEWCLCGDCRRKCHNHGIELVNIDPDFGYVAA